MLFFPVSLAAQELKGDLRLLFYNVENLFDPFDDSLTLDEEFLPYGDRHWTWERFLEKERHLYKVLASAGGWEAPAMIGLCEVENRLVLNWLTRRTPLLKYNYSVIHRDSPDERGMDVALLYLPGKFRPLEIQFRRAGCLHEPTRELLYVRGLIMERDTIHLILCHWPSRWDGRLESQPKRLAAAGIVRELLDSLWLEDRKARILVAGDLNDELPDESLSGLLGVEMPGPLILDTVLYNTGQPDRPPGRSAEVPGTLKYRGCWYEFDHIFASGAFFLDPGLYVLPGSKRIHAPDFLLEKEPQAPGIRPFRTYTGYRYHGGFSDHLPVYIDLFRGD